MRSLRTLRTLWTRLKRELRDLIELFLAPGLAVFLPWATAFRLFRFLSRHPFLYRDAVETAYAKAARYTRIGDPEAWKQLRRLTTLVDHADLYLVLSRPVGWMDKHLALSGQWPKGDAPGLLLTFHWGAGMWVLPHMREHRLKVHALVAPLQGQHFSGRRVLHWYAVLRTRQVAKELGHATIDVQHSLRPAMKALRERDQLLAVVDVPTDQASSAEDISFMGHTMRVPRALFRFAATQTVPIALFLVGFDPVTGRRTLRVENMGCPTDVAQSIRLAFSRLEAELGERSASWHLWSEADRFFPPQAPNQSTPCIQAP